jgi:hypothetical protein
MRTSGWRLVAFASSFFAVLFVAFGGLRFGYSTRSVGYLSLCGVLLGLVSAPELEPRRFRYPALWQCSFGAVGGAALAGAMRGSGEAFAVSILAGLLLGYFAPLWIKHIQVP